MTGLTLTLSFLKPKSWIISFLRACAFPTIFLIWVNLLVPPDLESSYTGRLFECVRSTKYVNRRGFGAGTTCVEADFADGEVGGGGMAFAVSVAVCVERNRALMKGVAWAMGVASIRRVVVAAGRRITWRIMMCWSDACPARKCWSRMDRNAAVCWKAITCCWPSCLQKIDD